MPPSLPRRLRASALPAALLPAALLLAALLPATTAAQPMPPRPKLAAAADTNDWEAYYDHAVARLGGSRAAANAADAAMHWAARLDPSRAEALYGRWITHWARDPETFAKYLQGDPKVRESPGALRADSLRRRALLRNPFVHQGLRVVLYDQLPGRFREDIVTRGWISYARGQLPQALSYFARAVEVNPGRHGHLRHTRAAAFVGLAQYDSALAQLTTLLADLRRDDAQRTVEYYVPKEMLEYGVALLHMQRGELAPSRAALGRAIAEDLAFAPAHVALGQLALGARDTAQAVHEYALAVELDAEDVMFRVGYGEALLQARRPADAVAQFREAVRREPHFATPYFGLAVALEGSGQYDDAVAAYRAFLARAPRNAPQLPQARQRLQAILAASGTR